MSDWTERLQPITSLCSHVDLTDRHRVAGSNPLLSIRSGLSFFLYFETLALIVSVASAPLRSHTFGVESRGCESRVCVLLRRRLRPIQIHPATAVLKQHGGLACAAAAAGAARSLTTGSSAARRSQIQSNQAEQLYTTTQLHNWASHKGPGGGGGGSLCDETNVKKMLSE